MYADADFVSARLGKVTLHHAKAAAEFRERSLRASWTSWPLLLIAISCVVVERPQAYSDAPSDPSVRNSELSSRPVRSFCVA